MFKALIERAKNLLLKPAATWDEIATEDVDVADVYKNWIIPLAAIAPVATFLRVLIAAPEFITSGLAFAVVSFGIALAFVYVYALIIDALAPSFGAEKNFKQAFKVAAYFPVASWLAGVFSLIPALAILGLLGLYSLYLLFVGLPKLMKPAEGKGGIYTLASIGVAIVLWIVISLITAPLLAVGGMGLGGLGAFSSNDRGRVVASSQFERNLQERADAIERATESGDVGALLGAALGAGAEGTLVEIDALRDIAPERLAGLPLQSSDVESMTSPVKFATLEAEYGEGDETMTLTVTNSPMLSMVSSAFGLGAGTYDRRTSDGYERARRDGDDMVVEEWNERTGYGSYGRTLGGEFMVVAQGQGLSMRELERAVGEFSERKLANLPRQDEE